MIEQGLRLEECAGGWTLAGSSAGQFVLVDEYLAYLADRNYSPKTVRAYGYDLSVVVGREHVDGRGDDGDAAEVPAGLS
ncbi:site-specific integrase [Nonomuraea sp. NPDC048916]|uniref:site-specific integrase n=1 Tax=Nonomuraea sp. NPDC048916 TaxID=3154232 RepID=UPI0033E7745D